MSSTREFTIILLSTGSAMSMLLANVSVPPFDRFAWRHQAKQRDEHDPIE